MGNLVLFAADWTKIIVPIVFFVLWALQQVAAGRQKAAKAPRAPRPQKPRPDAAEALRRQIETYLAETEQGEGAAAKGPAGATRKDRRGAATARQSADRPRSDAKRPAEPRPAQPRTQPSGPERLEPQRLEPEATDQASVASEVVASHIAEHVEDLYDHRVGHLRPSSLAAASTTDESASKTAAKAPVTPERIIDVIRNPRQLRNAIVLSNILERPRF